MNEKEFEFLGITTFHKVGYLGANIKIASCEGIMENVYSDVICPLGYNTKSDRLDNHGTQVMGYIKQVLPNAQKYAIPYEDKYIDLFNNMDVITTSASSALYLTNKSKQAFKDWINKGIFLCTAVGNDNIRSQTKPSRLDEWISIGAVEFDTNKKRVTSSVTEDLDFMCLDGLDNTYKGTETGTSFAAPLFAGMVGLVQDFFIKNTGKKLKYNKLLEFIKDHSTDYGELGFDNKYGNGLFILPNPETINIKKYMEEEMKHKTIVLTIDSDIMLVNGSEKIMDTAPFIKDNRTFVPIKFITEVLGCNIKWDETTRQVTINT